MSDSYVGVSVILRRRTAKAVLVSPFADQDESAWIPRSCIHGTDDRVLDAVALGDELTLRMFEWIAERENLL